jgi:hypothetical protein
MTATHFKLMCGCSASIVGDEIHVQPCCYEHEATCEEAAAQLGASNGIPFDVADESSTAIDEERAPYRDD